MDASGVLMVKSLPDQGFMAKWVRFVISRCATSSERPGIGRGGEGRVSAAGIWAVKRQNANDLRRNGFVLSFPLGAP